MDLKSLNWSSGVGVEALRMIGWWRVCSAREVAC